MPKCIECGVAISKERVAEAKRSGREPKFHSGACKNRWHSRMSRRKKRNPGSVARRKPSGEAETVPGPFQAATGKGTPVLELVKWLAGIGGKLE